MNLQRDSEFARFTQKRQRLNEQLDESRGRLDAWLAEHSHQEISVTDLAYLEGLLQARRSLLSELVALDETFMLHMLDLRNQGPG